MPYNGYTLPSRRCPLSVHLASKFERSWAWTLIVGCSAGCGLAATVVLPLPRAGAVAVARGRRAAGYWWGQRKAPPLWGSSGAELVQIVGVAASVEGARGGSSRAPTTDMDVASPCCNRLWVGGRTAPALVK